ncbi:MAG: hypothetical protein V3571_12465 [Pseudodesulfovibrio sp.]
MDEDLRERIRALAERHGPKAEALEDSLLSGGMPGDLAVAVADILAEIGGFVPAPANPED